MLKLLQYMIIYSLKGFMNIPWHWHRNRNGNRWSKKDGQEETEIKDNLFNKQSWGNRRRKKLDAYIPSHIKINIID